MANDTHGYSFEDDLAAQQEAARAYEPTLEGPRIGARVSSSIIAAEYAKADPLYVAKTTALPHTYPYFRQVSGDGNCGWRAIAFRYFEILIHRGAASLVAEHERHLTLSQTLLLASGHYEPHILEDFTDTTFELFTDLQAYINDPAAAMVLLTERFNDNGTGIPIMYHFRLLAASCLRAYAEEYEPFCDGLTIEEYCSTRLEPTYIEIEQPSINLLVEVLLRPANIVLEIVYLDLSPGSEANTYWIPADAMGQEESAEKSIMTLLYRPGHYDILYRGEPVSESVFHVSPEPQTAKVDESLIAMMAYGFPSAPSFEPAPATSNIDMASMPGSSVFHQAPGLESSWFATPFNQPLSPHATPIMYKQPYAALPTPPVTQLPMHTSLPTPPVMQLPMHKEDNFRFVQAQATYDATAASRTEQPTFKSKPFWNSPSNPQHMSSPNFQPEIYQPEGRRSNDGSEKATRGKGGRGSESRRSK